MYLCVTLLSLCLSAVVAMPTLSIDESLSLADYMIETTNMAGELILDDSQLEVWKRKCVANGGSEAFELSKKAGFQFTQCVQKIVNITVLRQEIEEKKKTGDLEEVFPKYCARKAEFVNCFNNFVTTSQPCFEDKELKQRKIIDDMVEKIINFVCFKEGDRIAMFIAGKGHECIEQKWEAINTCVQTSYKLSNNYTMPLNPLEMNAIPEIEVPSFSFDKKDCLKIGELQQCMAAAVETCENTLPANFLYAVFNYIRKSTPCAKVAQFMPVNQFVRRWTRQSSDGDSLEL